MTTTDALPLFTLARAARFEGRTYSPAADGPRLSTQLDRVRELMSDGEWRTLAEIARHVNGSEAGVSARLRQLRTPRAGGHKVERRRRGEAAAGLWEYRVGGEEVA